MTLRRNIIGFWLLGLCNNFAYVIMLSAAKDILEGGGSGHPPTNVSCPEKITHRICSQISTASVLLADIIPALVIKLSAPLFVHHIPFGTRHLLVVFLQAGSFLMVAFANNHFIALTGVVLASFGSGLGEISLLALSSHFHLHTISSWSSGTGGAGLIGAMTYAALTDYRLLHLQPTDALLCMLIVPVIFAWTFWRFIRFPTTVHRVSLLDPSSYWVASVLPREGRDSDASSEDHLIDSNEDEETPFHDRPFLVKMKIIKPLVRYMIPLILVYFGEYFINQGLLELLVFDCLHGFRLSVPGQYRWFQVIYQIGVFISRTFGGLVAIPSAILLAIMQLTNAAFFTVDALYVFVPHIAIIMTLVLYEGLLGGASYVYTFRSIRRAVPADSREFAMGFASISDTVGIMAAGILAIPAHNIICAQPLPL